MPWTPELTRKEFRRGQTRANADSTEAMSYARLAKAGNIYQQFQTRDGSASASLAVPEFARVTTEVRATGWVVVRGAKVRR